MAVTCLWSTPSGSDLIPAIVAVALLPVIVEQEQYRLTLCISRFGRKTLNSALEFSSLARYNQAERRES